METRKKNKKNTYEGNIKVLGKRIAEERKKKGLTQNQLAELCQLSLPNIKRVEKGENFTISSLLAIQEALRIKGTELMQGIWVTLRELD